MSRSYFLSGKLVGLRAVEEADARAYSTWLDDKLVTNYLEMGLRPVRRKDADAFLDLANNAEDAVVFAMDDLQGFKVVGTCGLYLIQWACRRAQFNILVGDRSAWDKGIGTEAAKLCLDYAFDSLNLNSVQLGVNADNERALRSYEKVGFVREGLRREFIYRNGRYYDLVVMSVLRKEYRRDP